MANLFSALELGKNSLLSIQQVFQIIGQNMANVNTNGYSRQVPILEAVAPEITGLKSAGRGVAVTQIFAYRSLLIDNQLTDSKRALGKFQAYEEYLSPVEAVFDESNQQGISDALSNFFKSWSDLANNPTNIPTRNALLNSAQGLSTKIGNAYLRLTDQQQAINLKIRDLVDRINSIGEEIAGLNQKIAQAENVGQPAHELIDRRTELIKELAEIAGATVYYDQKNFSATVEIGNQTFVSFATVNRVSVLENSSNFNYFDIYLEPNPNPINPQIKKGQLSALLDVRDNLIPEYKKQLDNLSYGLIESVNNLHNLGYGLDGTTTGIDFFVDFTPSTPGNYQGAALALEINPALIASPELIASADAPNSVGNNDIALQIANLVNSFNTLDANNNGLFDYDGTFHDYLHGLFARVGNDKRNATYELQSTRSVLNYLQSRRDSISGVSLDEEATSLMQFEKSYQAIAQFIGVVNSLTDVLIRIGRY